MKQVRWEDLSIEQIQKLYEIEEDESIADYDKYTAKAACIYNTTVDELESKYNLDQLSRLIVNAIQFMNEPCPLLPKKKFKFNGKRYKIEYNLNNLPKEDQQRMALVENNISNMYKYLAIAAYPVNRFGFRIPVNYSKHEQEILKVPFVYVTYISFYFRQWMYKARLTIPGIDKKLGMSDSIAANNKEAFQNLKAFINNN